MGIGHLWLKWMVQLWQSELLFSGGRVAMLEKKKKSTGLQGSTLSYHCTTMSFGPYYYH